MKLILIFLLVPLILSLSTDAPTNKQVAFLPLKHAHPPANSFKTKPNALSQDVVVVYTPVDEITSIVASYPCDIIYSPYYDLCSSFLSCGSCLASPYCGWCSSSGQCLPGTVSTVACPSACVSTWLFTDYNSICSGTIQTQTITESWVSPTVVTSVDTVYHTTTDNVIYVQIGMTENVVIDENMNQVIETVPIYAEYHESVPIGQIETTYYTTSPTIVDNSGNNNSTNGSNNTGNASNGNNATNTSNANNASNANNGSNSSNASASQNNDSNNDANENGNSNNGAPTNTSNPPTNNSNAAPNNDNTTSNGPNNSSASPNNESNTANPNDASNTSTSNTDTTPTANNSNSSPVVAATTDNTTTNDNTTNSTDNSTNTSSNTTDNTPAGFKTQKDKSTLKNSNKEQSSHPPRIPEDKKSQGTQKTQEKKNGIVKEKINDAQNIIKEKRKLS